MAGRKRVCRSECDGEFDELSASSDTYPPCAHALEKEAETFAVCAVGRGCLRLVLLAAKVDHEAAGAGIKFAAIGGVAHVAVASIEHHLLFHLRMLGWVGGRVCTYV